MKLSLASTVIVLSLSGWAHQYKTAQQSLEWAAHRGEASAQFQLASTYWDKGNRTQAYYWWLKSAYGRNHASIQRLMRYFPADHQRWLKLSARAGNETSQRQLAQAELNDGNLSLSRWLARWEAVDEAWVSEQVRLLNHYQNSDQCTRTIPVIASGLEQKPRYLTLLAAIDESPFKLQNWCTRWTVDENLRCTTQGNRKRAYCEVDPGDEKQVVFATDGIASANNQTLTLTTTSSVPVIQHELGHWAGFADEYAMSKPLAKHFCAGDYQHQSLNIVVTSVQPLYSADEVRAIYQRLPWKEALASWQSIATKQGDMWTLGSAYSEGPGLFETDTCNAVAGKQAWRAVDVSTAMEQHDTGYWPALYYRLFRTANEPTKR